MRRNAVRVAVAARILCLVLGLVVAAAGAASGQSGQQARATGAGAWPRLSAVVLDVLGWRITPAPAAAARPQAPPARPGRLHPPRFRPTCGVEINPNGGCV
jgi:hypothetical protein